MSAPAGPPTPAVFAVDGGNSKADVALVAADGTLLARVVGPTVSHQAVGLVAGMAALADLATRVSAVAAPSGQPAPPRGRPMATIAALCLAGADSPRDVRQLAQAIGALGLAERVDVRNDTEAPLRAGTGGWGVAVVCGTGINALGRAPNGRVARFAGLGELSGSFAGGGAVGLLALGAAAAAQERRAPRTVLELAVPAFFGMRRPLDVTFAIEHGELSRHRLRELAPAVFSAASLGDAVAREIVDRTADEVVAHAVAAIRRLRLTRSTVPVVLAGGLFRSDDAPFIARIREGIASVAPAGSVSVLAVPPVLGAALLGLDLLGATPATEAQLRATFAASEVGGGEHRPALAPSILAQ